MCRLAELGVWPVLHPDLRCDPWLPGEGRGAARRPWRRCATPPARRRRRCDLAADAGPRLYLALLAYPLPNAPALSSWRNITSRREYCDWLLDEVRGVRPRLALLEQNRVPAERDRRLLGRDERRSPAVGAGGGRLVAGASSGSISTSAGCATCAPILDGDDLRRMGIEPGRDLPRDPDRLRAAHPGWRDQHARPRKRRWSGRWSRRRARRRYFARAQNSL